MLPALIEQETPRPPSDENHGVVPRRWQLNRGGIVNVFQYMDEVLNFGDGRLLLRGANGAGKTTAMNMLLPFLLVARLRGLDAAGEQSGTQILRSWMLNGNDDPQRGGYLWVEFRQGDGFFVCGCGLKANRSAQKVNQWWFTTSQRPRVDFSLVENGVPLSERQLGDLLGGGHVFNSSRRGDYRREVEKQLFGGVSINQHIRLVNRVRNPRIGDRLDVEIPQLLKEALPQLRDRILDEVGGALDELEEHHLEVIELERTSKELDGIFGVYRSYCFSWLKDATDGGHEHLKGIRRVERERAGHRRVADAARREVKRLEHRIAGLEGDAQRLTANINALRSSPAYRNIREIDTQRELLKARGQMVAESDARASAAEARLQEDVGFLEERETAALRHLRRINSRFSKVAKVARRRQIAGIPPSPMQLPEPGGPSTSSGTLGEIGQFEVDLHRRSGHVIKIEGLLDDVRGLDEAQRRAEELWKNAKDRTAGAERDLQKRTEGLARAIENWARQSREWASRVAALTPDVPRGMADMVSGQLSVSTRAETETERERLSADTDAVIDSQHQILARADQDLSDAQRAEDQEQAVADRWAALTEPDLPYQAWQAPGDYCLADLVDFSPSISDTDRAGLEAAIEASGLLSARPGDQSVVLADGELVAIPSTPASEPLSRCLIVRIPAHLQQRTDEGVLESLLESLSTDPTDMEAPVVVSTDGTFRIGSLQGRHSKEHAEFIGESARQATLERGRRKANSRLERATAETVTARNLRDSHANTVRQLKALRKALPDLTVVVEADTRLAEAREVVEKERARLREQTERRDEAAQALDSAKDQLHTIARELSLPYDSNALEEVRHDLDSAERHIGESRRLLENVEGSVDLRDRAARRKEDSENALADAQTALAQQRAELLSQEDFLRALEDSIGEEERTISDQLRQHQADLEGKQEELRDIREKKEGAVERRIRADSGAESSDAEWGRLTKGGETLTHDMLEALATPGLWEAVTDGPYPSDQFASPIDLQRVLSTLAEYLPTYSGETVGTDSVYKSERERRDRLGGGWDAEIRSPDRRELPIFIEVTGPSGRQSLTEATAAVRRKHERDSKILAEGQGRELRDLLQGEIAREVAKKSHASKELVDAMRRHVRKLSTASQIGVDITWSVEPTLDSDTKRMVDLLSIPPDIRTKEQQENLVSLLGDHLEKTRAEKPEMGYKQALSEALDYKSWHKLQVVIKRGQQTKLLNRRNDLSEGEKKFVTYLPLFAAVAASCDSIADASENQGTARFVLLDDAFAKVSEDNHAQLFGLLTELDLDWIATSERLWGDHATIPELEIVEVIRDAELRAILLDRYRWNGRSLGLVDTHG